jgi:hypothetical protein
MSSKNGFSFLFPPPRTVRVRDDFLDIRNLCFPLEIFKKYDFLFDHFGIRNKGHGLEILFQERRGLAAEEYAVECGPARIALFANSLRSQFYALAALLQILSFYGAEGRMPGFSLQDGPEIPLRGFMLVPGSGAAPLAAELQGRLLELALLRFNCFALPSSCLGGGRNGHRGHGSKGAISRTEMGALNGLARKMGLEIFLVHEDILVGKDQAPDLETEDPFPAKWILVGSGQGMKMTPGGWFDRFMSRYSLGRTRGEKMLVWADRFLDQPEWIRKIPQDVTVLNRDQGIAKPDFFKNRILPFKKHHIPQVLCPAVWSRDRFIPAMRPSMALITAAFTAARGGGLAGVMVLGGEDEEDGCLPEGLAMLQFQAGSLFWSGCPPVPSAFSRWALGRDEPDLFRVYSFLSQVDQRLPHTHCQYLFEDPVAAVFSRQCDAREIETHYRKAALYLKKRKIPRNELTEFLNFAQQLYEFIAAKVDFSSRLGVILGEKGCEEKVRLQADWLGQGAEKLKNGYWQLWKKHFQPENPPRCMESFVFLQERFHYLRQASCRPAGRAILLAELKNYFPLDSMGGQPGRDL